MKTLGTYLTESLAAYQVDTVFGIPGVHTIELYRGLANSDIRHINARHEQSLGFMADGYARVTGKPGVCFVITGPGLTNISTAMGQAYADSIPMLVISGVNARGRLNSGDGYLHEMPNQHAFASQVCAFSHSLSHVDELPQVLARAFAVFDGTRPRPVHIEIPLDLMHASADALPAPAPCAVRLQRGPAHQTAIAQAAEQLNKAKRPLILMGGGSLAAAALAPNLAETLDAPCVMTINARGLLPSQHPLAISYSPSLPAVRQLMNDSDVVLAIGTELGQTDYDMYADHGFNKPPYLIRLDLDPEQLFRNQTPDLALLGDAQASLVLLQAQLTPAKRQGAERAAHCREQAHAQLPRSYQSDMGFLQRVQQILPTARWVGDSTQLVYAGNMGFALNQPRHWFNAATGFGSLGYGLPAAIGAALAEPAQTVICLAGDGGLQFTLAELGTAMETQAKLIVLLLNNHGYNEIKHAMLAADVPPLGVALHTPNFTQLAQSYGWQAQQLSLDCSAAQLAAALEQAQGANQPTLIELLP